MKQSDIITVGMVAVIGTLIAFFLTNALLDNPDNAQKTIKTIAPLSGTLVQPDAEVFNADALNPTVEVRAGDCLDSDQNGILDNAELVACGKAIPEEKNADEKESEKKQTEKKSEEEN